MENQIAQRRMSMIACHLGGTEEVKGNHLFTMNCSGMISSVIQRRDNRVFFARQGSASQACFMRQVAATDEDNCSESSPAFARQVQKTVDFPKFMKYQVIEDFDSVATEPPRFARPMSGLNKICECVVEEKQNNLKQTANIGGQEWSPPMDVAECASNYTLTIELPGVTSKNIRVEMDEKNLVVSGRRLNQWGPSDRGDPAVTYHRKEISQGPYQIVWLLPNDVNKDCVAAEFIDGFLRIMLPKI